MVHVPPTRLVAHPMPPPPPAPSRAARGFSTLWKTRPKHVSIVWKTARNLLPLCGKFRETWFHCVEKPTKLLSIVWKTFFAPFSPSFPAPPTPARRDGSPHHPSQTPLQRNGGARRPRRAVQEGACCPPTKWQIFDHAVQFSPSRPPHSPDVVSSSMPAKRPPNGSFDICTGFGTFGGLSRKNRYRHGL